MPDTLEIELQTQLSKMPRATLALLPTPLHILDNFSTKFHDLEIWIKRDDLTGLEGGGNKTRKLEYLVGDALNIGADMLVTIGAIQSNHTRQTAAAAAKNNLKCALLHLGWTEDAGPQYRKVGNILLSHIIGADLFVNDIQRPIEDQSLLSHFGEYQFDYIIHCTGSSSTQAGLLAGFAALQEKIHVVGISDDGETEIKKKRVLKLANDALKKLQLPQRVKTKDITVISVDKNPYGKADQETLDAISLLAQTEGLITGPVYEGKGVRGLISLAKQKYFPKGSKILLMHLGGSPAIHAYANHFGLPEIKPFYR